VWLAIHFKTSPLLVAGVAIAVFLGHLYPIFLKFKGGKGVATAFGIMVAIEPILALATMATWIIMAVFFRFSSLAALTCAVFAPFYYFFGGMLVWTSHLPNWRSIDCDRALSTLPPQSEHSTPDRRDRAAHWQWQK
jgi:acyl phosphate:glycerol-3-phosphate acyltransferase